MKTVTNRVVSLTGAIAAALVLVACSQSSSGTPTPQDTTAETTTSTKTSTSNAASTVPIADIDPCTLLTPTERTQLGNLGEGERKDLGGIGCAWSAGPSHRVAIVLSDKLGLDEVAKPGEEVIDYAVNDRRAKKIPGNKQAGTTGMCDIGLEIGPSARALIVVTMGYGTTEEACQIADQAAQVFEPKLPRS